MNEFITSQVHSVAIALRKSDGYVNATAMCQATGKLLGNYLRNATTKDFLEELSSVMRIRITDLILVKQGGIPALQGTWVHPDVAVSLGQWCSAYYGVAVAQWVNAWRTRPALALPPPHPETLRLWAAQIEETERQKVLALAVARRSAEQQVELQAKDAVIELYETRTALLDRLLPDDSNLTYDMNDASDFLGLPKGNITLIALLKHMGYLRDDKRPYEKKENWGLFTCSKKFVPHGVSFTTCVTVMGLKHIALRLEKEDLPEKFNVKNPKRRWNPNVRWAGYIDGFGPNDGPQSKPLIPAKISLDPDAVDAAVIDV
jgi:hypothetical protein